MFASLQHIRRAGFTLVELMVVLALVAMMAMVAGPQLLPILTLTEHENEARHLVGYGRAAMAQSVMNRQSLIVHVDMNTQEYWTTLAPGSGGGGTAGGAESGTGGTAPRGVNLSSYRERVQDEDEYTDPKDDEWIPKDKAELAQAAATINTTARKKELGEEVEDLEYADEEDQKKILERQQDKMQESFSGMTQDTLFARAKRIKHDHSLFDYEDDRFLNQRRVDEEEENVDKPVDDPLLKRHRVIESVTIQAVYIGDKEYIRKDTASDKNVVEIELSPLGLNMTVALELLNEDDDLLQVIWDPMTGNAWFKNVEEEG